MKTTDCVNEVVKYCSTYPAEIQKHFDPQLTPAEFQQATNPNNWKREDKRAMTNDEIQSYGLWGSGQLTIREFDCRPFNDQLRAITIDDGISILFVGVQGE